MNKKSLNKIEYFLRWNFLSGFILIGGMYLIMNSSENSVRFIAMIGVISLALWANHDRPESYSDYLKNEQKGNK